MSAIYRNETGAYWNRYKSWMHDWAHPNLSGAIKGRECLDDAWDLQADIEFHQLADTPLSGVLLDYAKFFDMFDPNFAWQLMVTAGFPEDIAMQQTHLAANIRRYLKAGGHYNAVLTDCNGVPQGCSLSLLVANLYVTVQFRMLQATIPDIRMGAVIDDRNLRHSSLGDMLRGLRAVELFDQRAGHVIEATKTVAWSTSVGCRAQL